MSQPRSLEERLADAFQAAVALDGPLDQKLEYYLGESRKLLPDLETAYDELVRRIAANGADELVPGIGDAMPDGVFMDDEGRLVSLSSLWERGPLVISFNRGPWCDYCGLELVALARAYPDIVASGAEVVSIVPETTEFARKLRQDRGLPFRVLTDLDFSFALSLGLVFWIGEKIKEMYRTFGIDLARFQNHGGWFLPIPATLIVGSDGRVWGRFVDPDFRHRMPVHDVHRAIESSR